MAWSRVALTVPLLYQNLFYVPPPPPVPPVVPPFNFAATTTAAPFSRTLYYQAKIAPPPMVVPLPPVVPIGASVSITTGQVNTKTLFYQALAQPVVIPAAAAAAPTIDWQQPFSKPVPAAAPTTRYAPFVPAPPASPPQGWDLTTDGRQGPPRVLLGLPGGPVIPLPPLPTLSIAWLQPFGRAIEPLRANPSDVVYAQTPPVAVSNLTTTLEWMVAWEGPPRLLQPLAGGTVDAFQTPTAAVSNLTTTLEWMVPWQGPPRTVQRLAAGPVTVPQASNLTTTLEWQIAWQGPPRVLQRLVAGVVNVPIPSNLTTTLEWQIAWQGPPRYWPPAKPFQPFVPKEAVLENTVPPQWTYSFTKAVPVPPVWPTQPFYGYPYLTAPPPSNLTTTLEWMVQWTGPPRYLQPLAGGYVNPNPAAPTVSNLTTTLEWMASWTGPPRVRPVHTQPVLGLTPSNLTTTLEWMPAWPTPQRYRPVHTPPVLGLIPSNLTTTLEWMVAWQKAVPAQKPIPTQPFYGYPYVSASNLTTTLEWQTAWQGPPRYKLPLAGGPVYAVPPVPSNLTTTIEWLQAWKGPPRYRPIKVQYPPFIPKETVQDRVGPEKWLVGFQKAVPAGKPVHTQPVLVYQRPPVSNLTTTLEWLEAWPKAVAARPVTYTQIAWNLPPPPAPVVVAFTGGVFAVTSSYPFHSSLFYQSWAFGTEPPPPPPPPPPTAPPKHSHGQIRSATAQTGVRAAGVVCVTDFIPAAFEDGSFSDDAFETSIRICEPAEGGPSTGQVRLRTARATTSSRWRKSRTSIRSSRSRTKPRDDP